MIYKELEQLVRERRENGNTEDYIQNALKEYLQAYILYFIYTSPPHQKSLIFTGGTCLRHFYGLERLSVDLDFNTDASFSSDGLAQEITDFFKKQYHYREVATSVKQKGQQLLFKFPVLHALGLASRDKSNFLHIKIDISPNVSPYNGIALTSKNLHKFNFVAKHYDLPTLMAGKLHAIFKRVQLKGKENRESIKGRDYFDLLWFLRNGIRPNLDKLSDELKEEISLEAIETRLNMKINELTQKHQGDFKADLLPLLDIHRDQLYQYLESYIENYQKEYHRLKNRSFADTVFLDLICQNCQKEFNSGITVSRTSWETLNLQNNSHACPHCGFQSTASKKDYILSLKAIKK